jgi:hypothetical protein
MKFIIFFFGAGIILLSVAIMFDINYFNYGRPIPYSQLQKIKFSDFRALKKPGMTLYGVKEFAFIKTSRSIHNLNNGDIEITTYFHPSRSYVFSNNIRDMDLLTHELYHFHISEYCTRLLRKEILENSNNISNNMIIRLNKKYYEFENEMQLKYDEDTYHSYVMREQKKWEIEIDSLVQSLAAFSDPFIPVRSKK